MECSCNPAFLTKVDKVAAFNDQKIAEGTAKERCVADGKEKIWKTACLCRCFTTSSATVFDCSCIPSTAKKRTYCEDGITEPKASLNCELDCQVEYGESCKSGTFCIAPHAD